MNALIEQYQIGDYLRSKISGFFFKIVNIPAKDYVRLKSMHSVSEFTFHVDELTQGFMKIDIFYVGELSQKLLSEIKNSLAKNEQFLNQMEKGISLN